MDQDEILLAASDALQILREQSAAIAEAADRLESRELENAVHLLLESTGKVILIGSGKSGIAARKIAATMTSTGTAAVYLHPVDALHGDLGIVGSQDVAIVLSNSGETEEILALLPHLSKRGVRLISIVGAVPSTLANNSDAVLDAGVNREAGPLNVAPTTSTTLAMVIGDALAMTLMNQKGFSVESFALNHPGGMLGKRLTTTVADLMHGKENSPQCDAHLPLLDVLKHMTNGNLGAVNVVDDSGELLGIVTDGDIRRWFQSNPDNDPREAVASAVMTSGPVAVTPEMLAYDALRLMEDRPSQISILPVVDAKNQSLGLIRLHDIVLAGLR